MVSLSEEQRHALESGNGSPVTVHDDRSNAVYVIVDAQTHERAMEALRQQRDLEAIAEGVRDMEAGRVISLDEMDRRMREEFGFPKRPL